MRAFWPGIARGLSSLVVVLVLAACGGGGGDGGGPYNPLWVTIDTQYLETTVATNPVGLEGSAYCENCPHSEWGVCDRGYLGDSEVNITWRNRMTGETGNASHGRYATCHWVPILCNCYVTHYEHLWSASVPLAVGDNLIEIRAYDASGKSATDSVAIKFLGVTGLYLARGIAVDTVNNEILVASTANSAIVSYARTDSGNPTPKRIITGISTGLNHPWGIAMGGNNEIFVQNDSSITVYARTASGDAPPIRTISGPSTGLVIPTGIAVDKVNNEIFVTNYGNRSITVYALTASGDAKPVRTISGTSTGLSLPEAIAVDTVNNEMFVTNFKNTESGLVYFITVYARTANGDVTPIRTISGASTGLQYAQGIAVDTVNNELLVTNYFSDSITVYARTASGDAKPVRTISGASTDLYAPRCIAVDTVNNEIFVTEGSSSILVYPRTANGNVVPTRTITNPTAPP